MRRLVWKSENGYEIEFTDYFKSGMPSQYWFGALNGNIGTGEAQMIKVPNQDGSATYGITRSSRESRFEGTIISRSDEEKSSRQRMTENRDYVARCFDPRYFGTLYYYTYKDDPGRKIRCRPTGFPAIEQDSGITAQFAVGFVSDESTWSAAIPLSAVMGASVKNLVFPHFIEPTILGYILTRAYVENPTLYDIKPVLEVYGNENAIEIHNITTGASLIFRENVKIQDNERIIIDTKNVRAYREVYDAAATPPMWVYKENVLHLLKLASHIEDFVIAPGENEFVIEKQFPETKTTLIVSGDIPVMGV